MKEDITLILSHKKKEIVFILSQICGLFIGFSSARRRNTLVQEIE